MSVENEITRQARLEDLPDLRKFIEYNCAEANLSVSLKYDIVLAIDETCTNIVTHGYEGMQPGPITIMFMADAKSIAIKVSDKGKRFHPGEAPEPDLEASWSERPIGGLGVYLIKQVADEVQYITDDDNVNHLTLIKKLDEVASDMDKSQVESSQSVSEQSATPVDEAPEKEK